MAESKEALANSQLLKDQEEERQQQVKARWFALEIEGKASRLALREPQLAKAKAAIGSAKARLRDAYQRATVFTGAGEMLPELLKKYSY